MKNLIKYKQGQRSKVVFIKKIVTQANSNWMELYQGESGSGKTYCALKIAIEIDPTFDVSTQLVFDVRSLMRLVNSEDFKKRKWKIIIFDEPQTSINSRTWQSLTNKLMNFLVSTFRHQNCILFFCCPYRDFLDSASMKMLHCVTEMVTIDRKRNLVKTRPKLQQYNSKLKKTYEHSIHIIKDGSVHKMIYDYIGKPPKESIKVYEKMKTDFTTKLNTEIEAQLCKDDKKQEQNLTGAQTPYQFAILDIMKLHKPENRKEMNKLLTEKGFYTTDQKLSKAIIMMRKRGGDIRL